MEVDNRDFRFRDLKRYSRTIFDSAESIKDDECVEVFVTEDLVIKSYKCFRSYDYNYELLKELTFSPIITGFFYANGHFNLVSRRYKGDLEKERSKRKFTRRELFRMARQLFQQLSDLHSRDICHLDIKNKNILVDHDGTIQLCDFELSAGYALPGEPLSDPWVVSNGYQLRELLNKERYDGRRVDVWSAGITLMRVENPQLDTFDVLDKGVPLDLELSPLLEYILVPDLESRPYPVEVLDALAYLE